MNQKRHKTQRQVVRRRDGDLLESNRRDCDKPGQLHASSTQCVEGLGYELIVWIDRIDTACAGLRHHSEGKCAYRLLVYCLLVCLCPRTNAFRRRPSQPLTRAPHTCGGVRVSINATFRSTERTLLRASPAAEGVEENLPRSDSRSVTS